VRRGEVYRLVLPDTERTGAEIKGRRYGIVVSNDVFNGKAAWKTIIVVPTSASPTQAERNYGIVLPAGTGGLPEDSTALCHQLLAIDRSRLTTLFGLLDRHYQNLIDQELRTLLYL
jgi:mRNA-degrading endonuclease toxin of MazEF toxin-antitoxin module